MTKRRYLLPAFLIISAILFLWGDKLKEVFMPIVAALLLTYIANPFVNFLSVRIPKILAAILFYVIILGGSILLISFIMPTFLSALQSFIAFLPELSERLEEKFSFPIFPVSSLSDYLNVKADNITAFLKDAFSFLTSATFSVVLSCFLLMDTSFLKKGLSS